MMISVDRNQGKSFDLPGFTLDGDFGPQGFGMPRQTQLKPLAILGIDDLQQSGTSLPDTRNGSGAWL